MFHRFISSPPSLQAASLQPSSRYSVGAVGVGSLTGGGAAVADGQCQILLEPPPTDGSLTPSPQPSPCGQTTPSPDPSPNEKVREEELSCWDVVAGLWLWVEGSQNGIKNRTSK